MSRSHPVLFSLLLRRFGWCLCLFGFGLSLVTASAQSLSPEISVERPAGINIADGSSSDLGAQNVGSTADLVFTIKNTGSTDLILSGTPKVVVSGTHASLFTITAQPTSPVAPASSTTFTVRFAPTSAGAKTAALSIGSDDADENPFDIQLTATGLGAGPLSGTDNFNDNSKDPTTWAAIDVTTGGASLVEANGRLEYRVTTPDVSYDEASRPWALNIARNTDAFDVILDVFNNVNPAGAANASVGVSVTSLENTEDSIYMELGRSGPGGDGSGFLAGLSSNVYGGDEVPPFTTPTNHPAVTTGSIRLSYNPTTKVFTAYYDATGSGDGFQWQSYGTFGVGDAPGNGATRNSPWQLSGNKGFIVSISGFSEALVVGSGSVYADNFSVITTGGAAPTVTSSTASNVSSITATLNGTVNPNGTSTTVTFEYGLTTSYGSSIAATLAPVSGSSELAVSATLNVLTPGATYHYRLVGVNGVGTSNGTDMIFTTASSLHVPRNLLTTLPAPATGVQTGSQLGRSVAVDGIYSVIGAPYNDTESTDSGVVKVYFTNTGALLHTIINPSPAVSDHFGYSVAISGSRVVVGAYADSTGASNAGSAYVYDLSSGTPTVPVATLNNPGPAAGDYFGSSVAISGTLVVIGAHFDDTGASNAGSTYVYDLASSTPTMPVITLNNPGPALADNFGFSVAISGTRVVVGAYLDDTGATDAGSAYVYDLSSGTPAVPVTTLNNSNPVLGDNFGFSVAISGTRLVAGVHLDDTGATNAGSAYIYDLSSGTPTVPITTLNNPSPALADFFGYSVAISGTRVVVGAYFDETGAIEVGSAYIYELSSGTPSVPLATLNNPGPAANDYFGYSTAISGTRVVVGAHADDTGATDAGSAYIYDLSSGTPTVPTATLNSPGPSTDDRFGLTTAMSGTRMVVGMPREDTGASNAGSVFVYDSTSGTPAVPVFTLSNPGPAADDNFGNAVAVQGSRVLVGAPFDDTTAANSGAAYFYDLSSGTPTVPVYTFINPVPGANDNFGNSVALEGTLLVIAAGEDDTAGVDTGSAYVYDLASATPTVPVYIINNPSPSGDDSFGSTVGISGRRIVIAAVSDDPGGIVNAGSVYAYDLSSGTPTVPVAEISNPLPATGDFFGYHAGISGTRIVVGALSDDTLASNTGAAYVYDLASGTSTVPAFTLPNPTPVASDGFGHSVAIAGNWVTVGASNDGTGATGSGTVYFYDLARVSPTVPVQTLPNPNPSANDDYGLMMAMDGQRFIVGAPFDDMVAVDKGAAYLYGPSSTPEIQVELLGDAGLTDAASTVNFGSSSVGFGSQKVFRITNQGGADLTGLALSVNGANASDFTFSALGSTTLAPGASTTFTVTFTAGAATSRIGDLHIMSNDTDESPFDVTLTGAGQMGSVDQTYDPQITGGNVHDSIELADEKILVGGDFLTVGGLAQPNLTRLNSDGTADPTFRPVVTGNVNSLVRQADGKILAAGSFTYTDGGISRTNLVRLNSDGTLDSTLASVSTGLEYVAAQSDGKIVVVGNFGSIQGQTRNRVARLNSDGTLDTGYNPNVSDFTQTVTLQPSDGKAIIGGNFTSVGGVTRNRIARLNTDGSLDTGFDPNASDVVEAIFVQADGKIIVGGTFTSMSGSSRSRLARLNSDGSLDTTPSVVLNGKIDDLALQSDGKIIIGGAFSLYGGTLARNRIARLNPDGSVDMSFNPDCDGDLRTVGVLSDGRIMAGGRFARIGGQSRNLFAILEAGGSAIGGTPVRITGGSVLSQCIMPDGKIMLGGYLTGAAGQARHALMRLWPHGQLDTSFNAGHAGPIFSNPVLPLVDGKLWYGRVNVATRLMPDGSTDSAQASIGAGNTLSAMAMQADGGIVVSGHFTTTFGTQARNRLARITPAGAVDTLFNPDANNLVDCIAIQPDGKILIGGQFTTIGGITRNRLARLNADGTLDTSFDPNVNGSVLGLLIQPDGQILVGGSFTTVGGVTRNRMARISASGVLDGYNPNVGSTVGAMALQADGRLLIGGFFTTVGGATLNRIARLNKDGSLDISFVADVGDESVRCLTLTSEGQVLAGGDFSLVNGLVMPLHVRLANTPASQSLTANFAGSALSWMRGGTSPEVDAVTFETSTDAGVTWTSQGSGARISGGWQLTGLSLPASQGYRVRARGLQRIGGSGGGDSSIYETIAIISASGGTQPEIVVEQPANAPLADALSTTDFGSVNLGSSMDQTYTIRNTGSADLTGLAVTVDGPHAADFSVVSTPAPAIATTGSTVFTVRFAPSAPGVRHAAIHIYSNDADEIPFDIAVTGSGQFNPSSTAVANVVGGYVRTFAQQADGKIWVAGSFDQISGGVRTALARLNADGSLDTSTGLNFFNALSAVETLLIQADGKLLFGGGFTTSFGSNLRRLNADGTPDLSFTPSASSTSTPPINALAQQSDGKLLIGGSFTSLAGQTRNRIGRLNLDGTLDASFNPDSNGTIEAIIVQADGKIVLGGSFTTIGGIARNRAARLNSDGTLDTGYNPNASGTVNVMSLRPDGSIIMAGGFGTISSTARGNMARVNSDGTLDSVFNPGTNGFVESMSFQTDGKILITGTFTTVGGSTRNRVARLNADGTLDAGYDPNVNASVSAVHVLPDGRSLIGGSFTKVGDVTRTLAARLNADGSLDSSFNPNCNGAAIRAVVHQADGKTLIGGWFSYVNDISSIYLARLNADGSRDESFSSNANGYVNTLATQLDGKIVVGGFFNGLGGATRNRIGRLLPNGTVDSTFDPNANGFVHAVMVEPSGNILLGGSFSTIGGTTRNRLARVSTTGLLDSAFNPNVNGEVNTMALQADGKILLGGTFTTVGGTTRNRLARVNADGTLDAGFNPNINGTVLGVQIEADGRLIVNGDFTTVGGIARASLARLNADGTLVSNFTAGANDDVQAVSRMTNGGLVVGGVYTTVTSAGIPYSRGRIALLNAEGRVDNDFNPSADFSIFTLSGTAEGRVLAGGLHGNLGGVASPKLVRLNPGPAMQAIGLNAAATSVTWARSGTSPEVDRVTFESSTDGSIWSNLGNGSRIAAGWQLAGLSLPTGRYYLRARGYQMTGGFYGGDGSVYETVQSFGTAGMDAPEIAVEQPVGTGLVSGSASFDFGAVQVTSASTLTFTVKNTGVAPLSGLAVTFEGVQSADYTITTAPETPLAALTGSTTFTVRFAPRDSGVRTATMSIWSNDLDENPFTISLTGSGTAAVPTATALPATLVQSSSATLNGFVVANGATTTISFDYGTTAQGYSVSMQVNPPTIASGAVVPVSLIVSGLPSGTTHQFRVRTSNSVGTTLSAPLTFTTPAFTAGETDVSFNPALNGLIRAVATHPDGRLVMGGAFTSILGTTRNRLARLTSNQTLDAGFNPDVNGTVNGIMLLPDGRMVIYGSFTTVNGVVRNRIARLNSDSSLDTGFNPNADNTVLNAVIQPDGRMLVSGFFTAMGGVTRNRIARVNADGTLDTGFNPDAGATVHALHLQADGKILVSGDFTTMGGQTRNRFAQLNADGTLNADFNIDAGGPCFGILPMPDGKLLIAGNFTTLGGVSRGRVARLNADGTLDAGFIPETFNSSVNSMVTQTDGKIILTGQFTTIGGTPVTRIARLNADGTLDTSFSVTVDNNVEGVVQLMDGRLIMAGAFTAVNGYAMPYFARLYNDTATQNLSILSHSQVRWLRGVSSGEAQAVTFEFSTDGAVTYFPLGNGTRIADGWEITGTSLPTTGWLRARAKMRSGYYNGSISYHESIISVAGLSVPEISVFDGASTAAPDSRQDNVGTVTFPNTQISSSAAQTFTIQNVGAQPLTGLVVSLAAAGDFTFTQPAFSSLAPGATTAFTVTFVPSASGVRTATVRVASNDATENPFRIAVSGAGLSGVPSTVTQMATSVTRYAAMLNGSVTANEADATVTFDYGLTTSYGSSLAATPSIVTGTSTTAVSARLSGLTPGTTYHYRTKATNMRGTNFGAGMTFTTPVDVPGDVELSFIPNPNGQVTAVAVQPDGKILIAGAFTQVGGISRSYLARLKSDGTLDATFAPVVDNTVNSLVVQRDGKIVIGGNFSTVNAVTRSRIARLMPDGSLDSGFMADADANVYGLQLLPDGKIVVCGVFAVISGVTRTKLALLNADGSADSAFNPMLNGNTIGVIRQNNGKLIVTGDFTTVNGFSRQRLARLNADGSLDSSFADPLVNGNVWSAAVQRDGKILIGGEFTSAGGSARLRIARFMGDGSLDAAYNPGADDAVSVMLLQADGRLLTAGQFTSIAGVTQRRLARLNADGTLDASFIAELDARATTLTKLADGRLLAGGNFMSVIGSSAAITRVALFDELPTPMTLRVTSPTRVEWLRGGAAAEAQWVKFEVSTDAGASWAALGDGTPISGGWELNGAVMPTAGQLRASATMTDSVASVSLHESIISFSGLPVPEISVFNGAGTAAVNARSDNSGVFDFGPLLLGSTATRTFTVQNAGTGVLTGIGVSFSGAGEFTATSPGSSSLTASASTTFTVTFAPTSTGVQTRTVLIASDDANENPFEIQITAHGQIPPAISGQPTSTLIGLSQPLNLSVAASGTALQYEWRRNGVIVPASNAATSAIAAATLGHVGEWQVRVFNGVGSVLSQIVHVGVVDLSTRSLGIAAGQTLVLQVAAAAPQATYRWLRAGVAIPRGINPETMLVLPNIAADQAGNYSLQVSMADPQNPGVFFIRTSGAITVGVVAPASSSNVAKLALQKPILNVFAPDPWIAGVEVNEVVTAQNSPSEFTVRGLPPGLKLNRRTGQISGRPTVILQAPKRYQLTITASNAVGICERSLKTSVIVQPLPGYTVGTYHGLIDRNENLNAGHGGRFTLNVSSLGAISGHLSLGAVVHRFATVIDPAKVGEDVTASVTIPRSRPLVALSLALNFHRHTGELSALLSGVKISAWRQSLDPGPLAQSYVFIFQPSGDSKGNVLYPQAASNLKLNISRSALAAWTGRFADGSTITGSSALTLPDCIMLSTYTTIRKSSLQGKFQFYRDGTATAAPFDWLSRSPTSGFPLHPLDVTTGK